MRTSPNYPPGGDSARNRASENLLASKVLSFAGVMNPRKLRQRLGLLVAAAGCAAGQAESPKASAPPRPIPPSQSPETPVSPEDPEQLHFDFVETPLKDALAQIARRGKRNLMSFGVKGTLTIRLGPISAAEAMKRVAREKNLVCDTWDNGICRVFTQEGFALLQKLDDPGFKQQFMQLVQTKASRADFDKLAPVRRAVPDSTNPELGLWEAGATEPSDKVRRQVLTEIPLATALVVYRVSFREVAAVFFGSDEHLRYYYLSNDAGLSLPGFK
jgi:hypothetical protein